MQHIRLMLLVTVGLFAFAFNAQAQINSSQTYVQGYTKADGTYVQGYYKTTPNNTNRDNFSTKPNINPYTSQPGYIQPDNRSATTNSLYSTPTRTTTPTYSTPSYSSPAIQTGPRGGQYYINSNGNKVYVKP